MKNKCNQYVTTDVRGDGNDSKALTPLFHIRTDGVLDTLPPNRHLGALSILS